MIEYDIGHGKLLIRHILFPIQNTLQIPIKVRFFDLMGHKNRVRVKSESDSLHFVSLRSHAQTHSLLTNIEGFFPIQNPLQIPIKVRFLDLQGHKLN